MGNVANELLALNSAKHAIRMAINDKGGGLSKGAPLSDYPGAIMSLPSGVDPENLPYLTKVVFIDWDGTVLQTNYVERGGSVTPPPAPEHTGLVFSRWTHPNADFESVPYDMVVGACYNAIDRTNAVALLQISVKDATEVVEVRIDGNYTTTSPTVYSVDWGDGTVTEYNTHVTFGSTAHTYSEPGNYEAFLKIISGPEISVEPALRNPTLNSLYGIFCCIYSSGFPSYVVPMVTLPKTVISYGQLDGMYSTNTRNTLNAQKAYVDTCPNAHVSSTMNLPYLYMALFADNPDGNYRFGNTSSVVYDIFSAKCSGISNMISAKRRTIRSGGEAFSTPGSDSFRTLILDDATFAQWGALGIGTPQYVEIEEGVNITVPVPTGNLAFSSLAINWRALLQYLPATTTTRTVTVYRQPLSIIEEIAAVLNPKGYTIISNPA